jgi:hypothetical protein
MSKNVFFILMLAFVAISSACSSTEPTTNTNANTNIVVTNQANLPPGFSTSPVPPSGNTTPGIPDPKNINVSNAPKGATPTPGIPDPKNMGKPLPKGATPTPGIPDVNTMKRQTNPPLSNSTDKPPTVNDMKSNTQTKTVRKP